MQVQQNVNISGYTTYGVEARAGYFLEVKNSSELVEGLNFAYEQDLEYIVLGCGSNVLFTQDYAGLVIINKGQYEEESGYSLPALALRLAKENVQGAEVLAGIPGTVGAAIRGNAGTILGNIGELIKRVTVWKDGDIYDLNKKECKFAYRTSRFIESGEIILAYELEEKIAKYDVMEAFQENLKKRMTQPKGRSCGSFFKNPEGDSAGRLIEQCGLKGKTIGGAKISEEHANWIINENKASGEDILKLGHLAQNEVEKRFGVKLEMEVRVI